jgi:hypothetical protein
VRRALRRTHGRQLFEAGLKKNPYSRDGLFNLATVYTDTALGRSSRCRVLKRLNAVDPENPDNASWPPCTGRPRRGLLRAPGGGRTSRSSGGRVQDGERLLLHSSTVPEREGEGVLQPLQPRRRAARAGGSIDNRSDEEKSYTLKFEFIDVSGKVLDTRELSVEGVKGKGSKSFRVEVTDKPGVAGFRYSPFPS